MERNWPEREDCFTCFLHGGDVLLKPLRGGNRAKLPPVGNNNWRCGATDCSYAEDVLDPSGAAHVVTSTEETDNRIGGGNFAASKRAQSDIREAAGVVCQRFSTGSDNTAVGSEALSSSTTPDGNTAVGSHALENNTTGDHNTAIGYFSLASNTEGSLNTAIGLNALGSNTTGNGNLAAGRDALANNTSGFSNVALGPIAGSNVTTAHTVICLLSAGDNIDSTTWIDNIFGVTTASGTTAPVVVSDGGQLGTVASSERFKKDIATMEKASEAILSLRPVTFHYKTDAKNTAQFGLIAEEVAKIDPALVLPDKEGKPYTVRYDAVNAMLLNEFLKEHLKVEDQDCRIDQQEATIAELKQGVQALTAQLKEQAAQIQKVSAQLELNKPAPQTVLNNR